MAAALIRCFKNNKFSCDVLYSNEFHFSTDKSCCQAFMRFLQTYPDKFLTNPAGYQTQPSAQPARLLNPPVYQTRQSSQPCYLLEPPLLKILPESEAILKFETFFKESGIPAYQPSVEQGADDRAHADASEMPHAKKRK